ncbi:MAG: hypothetical protein FWH51_02395 [Dehalococcoidia bacterium]|nr:hypothetical protein [Dehalococcoidia bacterium]
MQSQLKIGFLGLIATLALVLAFSAIFQPYSNEMRAAIEWHDYNPPVVGSRLIVTNASFDYWFDFRVSIKYDSAEYTSVVDYVSFIGPSSSASFWNGDFQDENGNFLDLREAMNSNAIVEIVAKREADGEYEAVRTYRVWASTVLVTATTQAPQ